MAHYKNILIIFKNILKNLFMKDLNNIIYNIIIFWTFYFIIKFYIYIFLKLLLIILIKIKYY